MLDGELLAAGDSVGASLVADSHGRVVQEGDGGEPGAGESGDGGDDDSLALGVVVGEGELDIDRLGRGGDVCICV